VLRLAVGLVPVRFADDGRVWLESPPANLTPWPDAGLAAAALGLPPSALDPALPVESAGGRQLFVPLRERAQVEAARVELAAYAKLCTSGPKSLYSFAPGARHSAHPFTVP